MRESNRPEDVAASNERSLSTLSRAITLSQGNFALILVRCNYEVCKQQMWRRLQAIAGSSLSELVLPKSITTLFSTIHSAMASEQSSALAIFGLESVTAIDQVLISTNQVRDEFRKSLTRPLVLWVTDEVLQKLTRYAPDFKSWAATSIKFELATDDLLALWRQTADELFATILGSDMGEFLPNDVLNLAPGCRRRQELESALRDLKSYNVSLEPELIATRQFILGRDAYSLDQIDIALAQYRQSLEFWQQSLGTGEEDKETRGQGDKGSFSPTSIQENSPHPFTSPQLLTKAPVAPNPYLERVGVLLQHIGLCYCRKAQLHRLACHSQWEQAKETFNACIEVFDAAGRSDLVAQLTIRLGEVLQHLQNWTDLQALALQSLEQPQTQNSPVRQAQAYGFLAAVALAQSDWQDAKDLALSALDILDRSESPRLRHRGCYLLLLARARRQLGELRTAIADLERAIEGESLQPNSLDSAPQLYIDILEELRSLYVEQRQYLRAFELKQEQRAIEQQYGFCTFLGASPLPPRHLTSQGIRYSTLEIEVAGRQPDVNRLLERLSRNDRKLTIIHGSSGVGKSSLINAGLVPALEARTIGARDTIPVVQKVYNGWVGELARSLTEALASWNARKLDSANAESKPSDLPYPFGRGNASQIEVCQPSNLSTLVEQLRLFSERNFLTVLIFDQFEEFFFVCTDPEQRHQFYQFLERVLNLPFLKVILCLREDYLHFLLEFERYCNLNAIDNNILDRQLRYYLGDLSPEDAKNVICTAVWKSQFQLEESLIDALVQDLARPTGAVRPIELQVVGQQVQTEKITTLAQYYALGIDPKATLVERFLLNAIADCGLENEDAVWQVLFSLTDDKDTRPLKTRSELEMGNSEPLLGMRGDGEWVEVESREATVLSLRSNVKSQKSQSSVAVSTRTANRSLAWWSLGAWGMGKSAQFPIVDSQSPIDLILKILVGSGLVFRVPEEPQDRYQLVHDYLVEPIREKYKQRAQSNIVARLERSEMALLRVRKQRLRAIAVGVTMAVMAVTAGGLGWRSEVQRRLAAKLLENAQLSAMSVSSDALYISNKRFDALLQALRAARRLKEIEIFQHPSVEVEPDTRLQVLTALNQAVYETSERNRLEGHRDIVWNVSFSPDGRLIASASQDKTVKLWHPDGRLVATLNGHTDSVTSVAFSPDGELIAAGSWDATVRLWRRDGTLVSTLQGHVGHIYSVSFSPNGQLIASGGKDGSIRIWTVSGKLVRVFPSHGEGVTWLSFSPDGQLIAAAGENRAIGLWTLDGKLVQTLEGHDAKVNSVAFSPDGQTLASASDDRTVKLWNRQGKVLKTFPKQDSWVLGVAFSPDGQFIASGSADNTVRLYSSDGSLLKTFTGHSDKVTAVTFSPVGIKQYRKTLNSKSQIPNPKSEPVPILASASSDKTIKLWATRDPSRLILQHQNNVEDVTFSPQSDRIATAGSDKTVNIWNREGSLLYTLRGHSDKVYRVSFSPDGEQLATASRDGTVKLWGHEGTLLKTLKDHGSWVLDVSFSPDGERLASASRDGTVKLWHRSGALIKTLTEHRDRVNAVSFSPDGQSIATASDDHTVKLWTANGKLLKTLQGHSNWVLDVRFSPDSQILASASYDNTVKLWSREGALLDTLKGHTDSVAHIRFSPTGKILATTSWDHRVQLWRLDDTLIKSLEGHQRRVNSISWSRDGKALASVGQDKTAIIWNLDLNDLLNKSCYWLRDYLQNNPKVRPSDRELCEPIEKRSKSRKLK